MQPHLTPREHEIIELLYLGLRQKEVASQLGISQSQVCNHLRFARDKYGANSTVELLVKVYLHPELQKL
jgi:DNA-binding CsgD family transcriptional regulator